MRILVLLAALLLWIPAFGVDMGGSAPAPQTQSVQARLERARQAIGRKDWSVAQRELEAAERDAPRNADVHNLLGYTYRKRPSPDMAKAYEEYDIALKLDPNHKGAREYVGEAYLQDGRLPEAQQQLAALQRICGGPGCEEYDDLAKAIADYQARH